MATFMINIWLKMYYEPPPYLTIPLHLPSSSQPPMYIATLCYTHSESSSHKTVAQNCENKVFKDRCIKVVTYVGSCNVKTRHCKYVLYGIMI